MLRDLLLMATAFVLVGSCATPPPGNDVEADIASYAYQNKPRFLQDGATALPFTTGEGGATIASSDIPWMVPKPCRVAYRAWLAGRDDPVADQASWVRARCPQGEKQGIVAVAITGGGNKSAVYSTEVLFELQRYGLADSIDVVSSVSGGSFTALLHALSCDGPDDCGGVPGWQRPRWDYAAIRARMETDYLWPFIGHRLRPDNFYRNWFEHHGADDDLTAIVSSRLLQENGRELTFRDLNPARPNLILNATNVTQSRPDFDLSAPIPEADKRPLSPDDSLHFAFTQQYFWRLMSDLGTYPVSRALVASAAFPLIIDRPSLRQYRREDLVIRTGAQPATPPKYVALYDGGVHDNFGVTELTWFLQCALGKPAGLAGTGPDFRRRTCGPTAPGAGAPAAALVLGINSSLLRSEGVPYDVPKQRGFDTYVLPVRISGVEDSVNMIMAASGEQRKAALRRLVRDANPAEAGPGYAPNEPENPEIRSGPFQYVDLDIEAVQILYCEDGSGRPGLIDRSGSYSGGPPNDRLVNAATGGSDRSRCDGLQGVLKWNRDRAEGGRDLQLPQVKPGVCTGTGDCPALAALIGDRRLMLADANGTTGGTVDLRKVFFDPANQDTPRLLNNRMLFDAVRTVPTDFQLSTRYAWLLRYTARWAVAHRIWQLCTRNRPLLDTLGPGKAYEVCDRPLGPRPMDDDVGSPAFNAARF